MAESFFLFGFVFMPFPDGGVELDLVFFSRGRRYGVEFKLSEAPQVTKSMRVALEELHLKHLWLIYPGSESYPVGKRIPVWPLEKITRLADHLD